jgi:hypothetical protein
MKRFTLAALAALTIIALPVAASAETGFQAGLDMDFLYYQNAFVEPGFAVMPVLAQGMEMTIGVGFGIFVHPATATTIAYPTFQIPVKVGFNFLFPAMSGVEPFLGVGLLPQFVWTDGLPNSFQFLIGPYLGGGVRFQIHPLMSVYIELEQPLLIGNPPAWLNTSTRIGAGLKFSFPDTKAGAN